MQSTFKTKDDRLPIKEDTVMIIIACCILQTIFSRHFHRKWTTLSVHSFFLSAERTQYENDNTIVKVLVKYHKIQKN